MYNLYQSYDNDDFLTLFYAFLFMGVGGPLYFGVLFLQGEHNEALTTTIFHVGGMFEIAVGWNLLLYGFNRLIEKPLPKRYLLYFFNNAIILPIVIMKGILPRWVNGEWVIVYTSPIFRLLFVGAMFSLIIEIALTTYKLVRDSSIVELKILLGLMTFVFLSSIPLFLLREELGLPLNLWTLSVGIYFLLLAIMIYSQPEVFLTTSVYPQFLLVINSENGLPIKIYNFVDNVLQDTNEFLFANAITAIQSFVKEITSIKEDMDYLGFSGLFLQFSRNESIEYILASSQESPALKSLLDELTARWMVPMDGTGEKFSSKEQELDSLVENIFKHQMNRLDLFLTTKN